MKNKLLIFLLLYTGLFLFSEDKSRIDQLIGNKWYTIERAGGMKVDGIKVEIFFDSKNSEVLFKKYKEDEVDERLYKYYVTDGYLDIYKTDKSKVIYEIYWELNNWKIFPVVAISSFYDDLQLIEEEYLTDEINS